MGYIVSNVPVFGTMFMIIETKKTKVKLWKLHRKIHIAKYRKLG